MKPFLFTIGQKDSQWALRHPIFLLNLLFSQLVFYRILLSARNVKNKGTISSVVPNLNTRLSLPLFQLTQYPGNKSASFLS